MWRIFVNTKGPNTLGVSVDKDLSKNHERHGLPDIQNKNLLYGTTYKSITFHTLSGMKLKHNWELNIFKKYLAHCVTQQVEQEILDPA